MIMNQNKSQVPDDRVNMEVKTKLSEAAVGRQRVVGGRRAGLVTMATVHTQGGGEQKDWLRHNPFCLTAPSGGYVEPPLLEEQIVSYKKNIFTLMYKKTPKTVSISFKKIPKTVLKPGFLIVILYMICLK